MVNCEDNSRNAVASDDALKAFPALEGKFADVAKASQAAIDAGASRAAQFDDFQKGVFGKLIGAEHPDDITRMVGSVFGRQDASAVMGRLPGRSAATRMQFRGCENRLSTTCWAGWSRIPRQQRAAGRS